MADYFLTDPRWIKKYKDGTTIKVNFAEVIWSVVGSVLCVVAVHWMVDLHGRWAGPLTIGVSVGLIIYRSGFLRLVKKNKRRLQTQRTDKSRLCLFSFQSWKSYLIIIVMVTLGYTLRHSSLPRIYLTPIYPAIGIGLFWASLHYYSRIQ